MRRLGCVLGGMVALVMALAALLGYLTGWLEARESTPRLHYHGEGRATGP